MKSSVFVRIDRYRELYNVIKQIRTKLDDARQVLRKIKDIKSQEDSEEYNKGVGRTFHANRI